MTVPDNDGVVHTVGDTYGMLQDPNYPSWRLACELGLYRHYDAWRGRQYGLPLTCMLCIDRSCDFMDEDDTP